MLFMKIFLTHIKDQSQLENTILSRMYAVGLLILGLLFGYSTYLAYLEQANEIAAPGGMMIAVFLITGVVTTLAYYYGFSAVVWAMSKLLGGRNKFLRFIRVSGNAIPPLWVAVPLFNYYMAKGTDGAFSLILLTAAGLCGLLFIGRLISVVAVWFDLNRMRACMTIAATFIFLGSFLYLQLG
jgi:hypothetical protein